VSFSRRPNPVFSDSYAVIRQVLIGARHDAKLSQAEVAGRLGRSKSHIARIECGERRIDALELYRMAKVLGLEPARMFEQIAERLDRVE